MCCNSNGFYFYLLLSFYQFKCIQNPVLRSANKNASAGVFPLEYCNLWSGDDSTKRRPTGQKRHSLNKLGKLSSPRKGPSFVDDGTHLPLLLRLLPHGALYLVRNLKLCICSNCWGIRRRSWPLWSLLMSLQRLSLRTVWLFSKVSTVWERKKSNSNNYYYW